MSEIYKATGKVHDVLPVQTFGSGFQKRTLVLDITSPNSRFTDYAAFEFTGDNVGMLGPVRKGATVTVKFRIQANENKNKPGQWFSSNRAFSIQSGADGSDAAAPQTSAQPRVQAPAQAQEQDLASDTDNLPF